ncbi:MAG: two-component sensor histidine kinase [Lachnospiraceae bacterium]|nr:two-component sensor histidine kinase [Lachnospiraceae bacterium]
MKRLFKSLRSRIIFFLIVFSIVPCIVLHTGLVATFESHLVNQRLIEINQRCHVVAQELGKNEKVSDSLTTSYASVLNWYSEAYGGRILIIDQNYKVVLDTFNVDLGRECISDVVFKAFEGQEYQNYDRTTEYLEFVVPVRSQIPASTEQRISSVLILSSTTDWIMESFRGTQRIILLLELVIFGIILFFALYVSYMLMQPVNVFREQLSDFGEGHRDSVPAVEGVYSELNSITDSLRMTIQRYQDIDRSQEEFVSNASHELRTPMTSIRVLSDSLIGQENIPEETYQEFLKDISVEIDREARIIEDLLQMTKMGKASDTLNIQTTDMNEFVIDLLKSIRPIAASQNVELIYESFRQVNAEVDSTKLNQAFSNLVENAVKYNNDGGYVKVSLDADHEYFYLMVSDNGIGIPEEALPHIFDRFYRVDKARSRDTGGTGLGLSITRGLIQQHHGIIKVESEVNKGTTFTVRVPLKYERNEEGSV